MKYVKEFESCLFMLLLFEVFKRVFTRFIAGRVNCLFLFVHLLFICALISTRPAMLFSSDNAVLAIDDFHPVFYSKLEEAGIQYKYLPNFNLDENLTELRQSPIVAVRSKLSFNSELIEGLPALRCIARGGAGMDNIDEKAAEKHKITLLNAPEGNRDAVAEHAMGMLLSISNHVNQAADEVRNGIWNRESNRGWEIGGKTVGIIGYGNTGTAFAKRLCGFDCEVLAYDKYKQDWNDQFAVKVGLKELYSKSDIVSYHVPLTAETKYMISGSEIAKMKDGVVLLNTARGNLARNADLLLALRNGKIKALGLDVLEHENPEMMSVDERSEFDELVRNPRVLVTPHVAGWTTESYKKIASILADKIIDFTMKMKNI